MPETSEKPLNPNPLPTPSSKLRVTLRLETLASGTIAASVMEFPDCRIEAATREEAIAQVQAAFLEQITHVEIIPWDVPLVSGRSGNYLNGSEPPRESPWRKFAGMFQDDSDFAEIATTLRAERNVEDDTEVDPLVYSLENRGV